MIPFHVFTEVRYTKQPGKEYFYTSGKAVARKSYSLCTQSSFQQKLLLYIPTKNKWWEENFFSSH